VTGGVRRRLPFLLCLVVLAGCGDGKASVKIPQGFTVRTVEKPALSIALPASWLSFGDRSHTSAKSIAGKNERLRVELETLAQGSSPIKLVGVHPAGGPRSTTNMNVLQTQVPAELTFEQMARIEATQIRRASSIEDIRQEETRVPAGRTLHLTYNPRASSVVQQYFVRHDNFLYVLTYTSRAVDAARYAKSFDQSAHTFQVG
jgi:hypothetical protein